MKPEDELAKLLERDERMRGAPDLARHFGATHLCFFIRDPDLNRFLPGPGFPQRLRSGVSWARFLLQIENQGHAAARLLSPFSGTETGVTGWFLSQDACVIFFGDDAWCNSNRGLASCLKIFGALLLQEVHTGLAEIKASLSSGAAAESRQLATSLSEAHDLLSEVLQARESLIEENRRKDQRLRRVRQIAGIGTWEFHPVTRLVKISPEVQAIYGIAEGDTIHADDLLARIHPDDRDTVRREISAAYSQRTEHRLQFRIVWPNGNVRWVEDRGTVVYDTVSKLYSIVGFSLDITQRVLTEKTLIRSEKLSAAGRLAASIAHEINNPLEALVNLIYLAKIATESENARELLTQADAELVRVSAVSRQALAFYRDVSAPTRFDIGQAITQTVELFRKDMEKAEVRPILELIPQTIELLGWPGEIKQAVSNLLINAIHASSPATILRVRVRKTHQAVRILIADQGHGITKEHRLRIFEPFFSTKKDSGTGLGLWITQQIITKHGGSIQVRSRSGLHVHGTIFVVELPIGHEFAPKTEMHERYRKLADSPLS